MRVKCVSTYPTSEQLSVLGDKFYRHRAFHLTIGKFYLAQTLSFYVEQDGLGTGPWVQVQGDTALPVDAPLCLFATIDARVSRYWDVVVRPGELLLSPGALLGKFFYDDLSEGVPEVVATYRNVVELLNDEFKEDEQN